MLKEKVARAIKQLKKGKTEYFDEIYDLTRASVYYVIRGVLKDNYLVEDAMQETYVAFLNSIAKIDDEQTRFRTFCKSRRTRRWTRRGE